MTNPLATPAVVSFPAPEPWPAELFEPYGLADLHQLVADATAEISRRTTSRNTTAGPRAHLGDGNEAQQKEAIMASSDGGHVLDARMEITQLYLGIAEILNATEDGEERKQLQRHGERVLAAELHVGELNRQTVAPLNAIVSVFSGRPDNVHDFSRRAS